MSLPRTRPPHFTVGVDGGSVRRSGSRLALVQRQRKEKQTKSTSTHVPPPQGLCGDRVFRLPGYSAGPTGPSTPTGPIRTTPASRKGGPDGPLFRHSIFSFDRPRPFSFRCLEKKMGAESPGNLPAPGKGDLSQKPAPRVPFIRHLPRKRRLPRRGRLLAWARPQFCRPSAGRPAPTFSRFAFFLKFSAGKILTDRPLTDILGKPL